MKSFFSEFRSQKIVEAKSLGEIQSYKNLNN